MIIPMKNILTQAYWICKSQNPSYPFLVAIPEESFQKKHLLMHALCEIEALVFHIFQVAKSWLKQQI